MRTHISYTEVSSLFVSPAVPFFGVKTALSQEKKGHPRPNFECPAQFNLDQGLVYKEPIISTLDARLCASLPQVSAMSIAPSLLR